MAQSSSGNCEENNDGADQWVLSGWAYRAVTCEYGIRELKSCMRNCVIYLAATGLLSFIIGRLLPKRWFHADWFPFRSCGFEQDGLLYERLKIKSWQNKLPDMSRILPGTMPRKQLRLSETNQLPRMIQETCIAELTHAVLCVTGLYCIRLWNCSSGIILAICNVLGNLPFILIQRYNRPRLVRLQKRIEQKGTGRNHAGFDFKL